MYIDFSGLFHQSSKDRTAQGSVRIPADQTEWPSDWKTHYFKRYPRLPSLELPDIAPREGLLRSISRRQTQRSFTAQPLSASDIATLLRYSCGETPGLDGMSHRAQASGGARYPIEVYPVVLIGTHEIPAGVYHYDVMGHALEQLWERPFSSDDIGKLFTYPWARQASIALVLTGVFSRSQAKYGERGYRHVLIEAGSILQNVYVVASELGIQCCAIDGVHEQAIETLLDIDGFAESAICSMVLGR